VYHSAYDNHHWVARIGDPGFRYHAALVQLWGVAALRLANADILPLDAPAYAARLHEFTREIQRRAGARNLSPSIGHAVERLQRAAAALDAEIARALERNDREAVASINRRLLAFERAFIDPAGIPGRPWYRHQIFAPKFTYAAEVLPALAEAIDASETDRIAAAEVRVTAAIERAAGVLGGSPGGPARDWLARIP
jgi:N-acetylated-alpha-linked acidic dipeptidase